jgi:high-affinity nickel-transport protein
MRMRGVIMHGLRRRAALLLALLVAGNLLAWAWAFVAFRLHPLLLGTALLAYGMGLRHAVDADHIAAIDNVTRKLMHEGKRPLGVGLFFSLGHSTIVVALSVGLVLTTTLLQGRFDALKEIGGVVGTAVSAFFLFAIAAVNLTTLAGLWGARRRLRRGERVGAEEMDVLPASGLLGRLFRRLFRLIGQSWHMYPLGVLFGLGFDTATEVGLLGISAVSASQGLPLWSILVFPALFSAGMALVDTADGILMLGAYGWAFVQPARKLTYNLAITLVSVVAALFVGAVELLGLLSEPLGIGGALGHAIDRLNDNMGMMGGTIIAACALGWLASLALTRRSGEAMGGSGGGPGGKSMGESGVETAAAAGLD